MKALSLIISLALLGIFATYVFFFAPLWFQLSFFGGIGLIIVLCLIAFVRLVFARINEKNLIYPNEQGYLPTIRRGKEFFDLNAVGAKYRLGQEISPEAERQALMHYLTRAGGSFAKEFAGAFLNQRDAPPALPMPMVSEPGQSLVIDAVAEDL